MSNPNWEKGQKVAFTDQDGNVLVGAVDFQKRGWVMVELDNKHQTPQGWAATKMMFKAADLSPA